MIIIKYLKNALQSLFIFYQNTFLNFEVSDEYIGLIICLFCVSVVTFRSRKNGSILNFESDTVVIYRI